jgi:hypothetical protein
MPTDIRPDEWDGCQHEKLEALLMWSTDPARGILHRRERVVYALHGNSIGAEQWMHEIHVPQTIEGAFPKESHEMIVVLPDSKTIYNGSMYSSSVTTGDFEKFKFTANAPPPFVDQYIGDLSRSIAPSPSTSATGTACASIPQSCTTSSITKGL